MRLNISNRWTAEQPQATAEKPSFAEFRPRRPKSAVSFAISLCLHATTVWVVGSTVQAVKARQEKAHEYPTLALQMATLTLPASLIRPKPRADAPAESGSGLQTKNPVTGTGAAPLPTAAPAPAPAEPEGSGEQSVRQEKHFQLPATPIRKRASQVLVRLDVPPEIQLKPKVAVPEIFLWQLPKQPKPKQDLIASAHREEKPIPRRETPVVTPQLEARNREEALAKLRHAAAPPVAVPVMPLPVTNTTPIRLLDGIAGTKLPSSTGPTTTAPEAVHVISIPEIPVPQARVVVLPAGNQGILPASSSGTLSEGSGKGSSKDATASGSAGNHPTRTTGPGGEGSSRASQTTSAVGGGGSASGAAVAALAGSGGGSGTSTSLTAGSGAGASGNGPGSTEAGAGGSLIGGLPPAGAMRIERPQDGKFSVVVLGSSNLDAYPEARGILGGKLVYTVYIRAGGRKEWILQYCLPKEIEPANKLRGTADPLDAPYPFLIFRPKLNLVNDPDYVIVHGFISVKGRFERLSAVGDIDAGNKDILIKTLEHWEFRPAARDGAPSAVEIALIIPREPI